jgi:AcrR family transcriptional regulator
MRMSDFALNVPRQQRSAESWERVLVAGAKILGERGYEGFTVSEVCRRAGVTTGSIYARVPSKEALFHVISEREIERIIREAAAHVGGLIKPGQSLDEFIEAITSEFIDEFERERGLLRAMLIESNHDPVIHDLGHRITGEARNRFAGLFEPYVADIKHPEPAAAVDLCFRLLSAMMVRRITIAFDWDLNTDTEAFSAEMSGVFKAYLLYSR